MSMLKNLHWKIEGNVYGDASAALGVINRIGLGKTRHIDTSLLWIEQTTAERHLIFAKVLAKKIPADLYTKHLDQNTSDTHVKTLQYKFEDGRASEAPKFHLVSRSWRRHASQGVQEDWKWLQTFTRKNGTKFGGRREINLMTRHEPLTDSGPWVLWGYTRQVQGFTGLNAAQLSRPQGSTLTFKPRIGVSWVHGLRHGVAMHPRGRHLRECMSPWSHGKSHTQARKQQPPHQPIQLHDQSWRNQLCGVEIA